MQPAVCPESEGRSRSSAVSAGPGSRSSRPATQRVPPAARARKISAVAMSKPNEATCKTRLPGPASKARSTAKRIRFDAARCVTSTPLGSPVEPEV